MPHFGAASTFEKTTSPDLSLNPTPKERDLKKSNSSSIIPD
jgi:hypothetical protein